MVEGVKNLKEDRRRARQAVAQVNFALLVYGMKSRGVLKVCSCAYETRNPTRVLSRLACRWVVVPVKNLSFLSSAAGMARNGLCIYALNHSYLSGWRSCSVCCCSITVDQRVGVFK